MLLVSISIPKNISLVVGPIGRNRKPQFLACTHECSESLSAFCGYLEGGYHLGNERHIVRFVPVKSILRRPLWH